MPQKNYYGWDTIKILQKVAVIIVVMLVLFRPTFLYAGTFQMDLEKYYSVGADGSTIPKNSFDGGERPYIYAKLAEVDPTDEISIFSQWGLVTQPFDTGFPPNTTITSTPIAFSTGQSEFWFTPDNWYDVNVAGDWFAGVTYSNSNVPAGFGADNYYGGYGTAPSPFQGISRFTVTPEPATMALFGLGGVLLAWKRKRRNIK